MIKFLSLFQRIHIHPLFWGIAIIAVITARFYELLILFFIVFVHELGHAFAAVSFSWRIKRILLLPFGGVAEFVEHESRPLKEELIVVLSGPLQHGWLMAGSILLHEMSVISEHTHRLFIEYNWMILLFNLLPIFPLDGGRMLHLSLCYFFPYIVALKRTVIISLLFLIFYGFTLLTFAPYQLNGWLIFAFLIVTLVKEWKNRPYVFMRFLLHRHGQRLAFPTRRKKLYVSETDPIQHVLDRFYRGVEHCIIVKGEKGEKRVKERDLLALFFERNSLRATVGDLFP